MRPGTGQLRRPARGRALARPGQVEADLERAPLEHVDPGRLAAPARAPAESDRLGRRGRVDPDGGPEILDAVPLPGDRVPVDHDLIRPTVVPVRQGLAES